jgi:hypothetical protein
MAVGADHLALRDLVEDAPPTPIWKRLGYVERLVAEVVELEDHRILFTAVDARVGAKVVEEVLRPLKREGLLPASRLIHVALAVRQVVLVVLRSAWAAQVVTLPELLPPPVEGIDRLHRPASAAPSPITISRLLHTNTSSHTTRTETRDQSGVGAPPAARARTRSECRFKSARWLSAVPRPRPCRGRAAPPIGPLAGACASSCYPGRPSGTITPRPWIWPAMKSSIASLIWSSP